MIWEELRDDLIFYDLQAVDYKEVLQSMGDAMIQAGYGEEGFTEAVLAVSYTHLTLPTILLV